MSIRTTLFFLVFYLRSGAMFLMAADFCTEYHAYFTGVTGGTNVIKVTCPKACVSCYRKPITTHQEIVFIGT